jgi:hypothetical protein
VPFFFCIALIYLYCPFKYYSPPIPQFHQKLYISSTSTGVYIYEVLLLPRCYPSFQEFHIPRLYISSIWCRSLYDPIAASALHLGEGRGAREGAETDLVAGGGGQELSQHVGRPPYSHFNMTNYPTINPYIVPISTVVDPTYCTAHPPEVSNPTPRIFCLQLCEPICRIPHYAYIILLPAFTPPSHSFARVTTEEY